MSNRIPCLDGFRALSIALVLISHAAATQGVPGWLATKARLFLDPGIGVKIFFVISGLLITSLLLREEEKHRVISLKYFYLRRFLRILPVYWSYVVVVLLADRLLGMGLPGGAFVHALTFTTGFTEAGTWPLGHTWSLSVEEFFYLAWPITFYYSSERRRFCIAAAIICAMPVVRVFLYKTGHTRLLELTFLGHGDAIMCGCWAALLRKTSPDQYRRIIEFRPAIFRSIAVAVIVLMMMLTLRREAPLLTVPLGVTLQSLAISYLICSYSSRLGKNVVSTFLNLPVVTGVGLLSYSLYIWQQFFLYPQKWGYAPEWWQRFPQNLGLVVAAAVFSYVCIERPFLRLKQRFSI